MSEWIPICDQYGEIEGIECPQCGNIYILDGYEPYKCNCGCKLEYRADAGRLTALTPKLRDKDAGRKPYQYVGKSHPVSIT